MIYVSLKCGCLVLFRCVSAYLVYSEEEELYSSVNKI